MRNLGPDRPLIVVTFLLAAFGLATLYSAGQTDVATQAGDVWMRQLVWMAIGVVAAAVVFRVSFRLLEWLAPAAYVFAIILLLIVLVVGTGRGDRRRHQELARDRRAPDRPAGRTGQARRRS